MLKVTDEICEAARRLLLAEPKMEALERKRLEAIANGERKRIDAGWWRNIHHDVSRARLDKLAALADPARNDRQHERAVAERKLSELKSRRPPGVAPRPAPLPSGSAEWEARRKRKRKPDQTAPRKALLGPVTRGDPIEANSVAGPISLHSITPTERTALLVKRAELINHEVDRQGRAEARISKAKSVTASAEMTQGYARLNTGRYLIEAKTLLGRIDPDASFEAWCGANVQRPMRDCYRCMALAGQGEPERALWRERAQRDEKSRLTRNERRSAERAAVRAGLKCQTCGKPLTAQRPTARYCGPTCRSHAWRKA